jgi:hypothetical protein
MLQRLTCAGLSICKDGAVEPLQHLLHDRRDGLPVYLLLVRLGRKDLQAAGCHAHERRVLLATLRKRILPPRSAWGMLLHAILIMPAQPGSSPAGMLALCLAQTTSDACMLSLGCRAPPPGLSPRRTLSNRKVRLICLPPAVWYSTTSRSASLH